MSTSIKVVVVVIIIQLIMTACSARFIKKDALQSYIQTKNFNEFIEYNKKIADKKNKDEVVFALNTAMGYHLNTQYQQSNNYFERAKIKIEKYKAISVVEQIGSILINDKVRSYESNNFELAMLHFFKIMNYIKIGKADSAMVEVKQWLTNKKKYFNKKELIYYQFMHLLSALIYLNNNKDYDALIELREAKKYFGDTQSKFNQLFLCFAKKLGSTRDLNNQANLTSLTCQDNDINDYVFVYAANGIISSRYAHTTLHQNFSLSVPYYKQRRAFPSRLSLQNIKGTSFTPFIDLDLMARAQLRKEMPAILSRGVARNISRGVLKSSSDEAKILAFTLQLAFERADTRSWNSLPYQIQLTIIPKNTIKNNSISINGVSYQIPRKSSFYFFDTRGK